MRKITRKINVNRETLRKTAKEDLRYMPDKQQKVHYLDSEKQIIRVELCKILRSRAAENGIKIWLSTDKKIFSIEQYHNHQNDRAWSVNLCDVEENLLKRNREPKIHGLCRDVREWENSSYFRRKRGQNQ